MEIYERIEIIRKEFFGNNINFAKAMGEKPTTTSGWCSGTRNIGINVIQKILEKIPNINDVWLYTGKGSMLLPESENLSENKSTLAKQSKEEERNSSIDGLVNQKIEKVVMENLDKTIATIMKGMNKNNEQQNAHVEKILKIQSEENSRNFNTLIDAVREIVREEDREKFDRKIVQLKTRLG